MSVCIYNYKFCECTCLANYKKKAITKLFYVDAHKNKLFYMNEDLDVKTRKS